jgi:hypothetical protein
MRDANKRSDGPDAVELVRGVPSIGEGAPPKRGGGIDAMLERREASTAGGTRPSPPALATRFELAPIQDLRAIVREEVETAVRALAVELRALLASHPPPGAGIESLLKVQHVAKLAGVAHKTVQKYVRAGKLRPTWFGNEMRVAPKDLELFLRQSTGPAEPKNMDLLADKILGKVGRK